MRGKLKINREKAHHDVCEDGITPALTGYVGDVPDAPGYENEIIEKWGGGSYRVIGIDEDGKPKATTVEVSGYSKPPLGSDDK